MNRSERDRAERLLDRHPGTRDGSAGGSDDASEDVPNSTDTGDSNTGNDISPGGAATADGDTGTTGTGPVGTPTAGAHAGIRRHEAMKRYDDGVDDDDADDDELDEPAPPTISVDLPQQVHAMPDDEIAVAIVDVPVDPSGVQIAQPATTSIPVIVAPPISEPVSAATASTSIVPLPTGRGGPSRRGAGTGTGPIRVSRDVDSADATIADGAVEAGQDDGGEFAETTYSRRDRLRGAPANTPEPAAMLTAERLLGAGRKLRPRPEGRWPEFVFATTFHLVNLGDSRAARERKVVDARIHKSFAGGTRFVPVLTRKGGVGKTTVTTLLGMALANAREDRIIAIDANPDRGTLAERVSKQTRATVRDVVHRAPSVSSFADFTNLVSRDETRLDILASDTDPLLSEAFNEDDYNVVADLCARFYSIALTDCGTGIVHSVMRATLQRADSLVIVSGGSVDEARLASETLTWLEANGYSELVRNAVVALNTATQGTTLVKLEEVEAHFRSRVREIVRIPYDPQLAAGSVVSWKDLKPLTRTAARELAALVVDGLPATRPS